MQQSLKCPNHKTQNVVEVCMNENLSTTRLACHTCHQQNLKDRQYISLEQLNGGIQNLLNKHTKASQEYKLFIDEFNEIRNMSIDEIISHMSAQLKNSIDELMKSIREPITKLQAGINKAYNLLLKKSGYIDYNEIYESSLKQTPDDSSGYQTLNEKLNILFTQCQKTDHVFADQFKNIQQDKNIITMNISVQIDQFQQTFKTPLQEFDEMLKYMLGSKKINILTQSIVCKPQDATKYDQILLELLTVSQEKFLFHTITNRLAQYYPKHWMQLIYKGTRDGLNAISFKDLCFNKAPTLMIIHTNANQIIGGVTNILWSDYGPKRQPGEKGKNFLFSITKEEIYDLQNTSHAINCEYKKEKSYLSLKFNDDLIVRIPNSSLILPTTLFSVLPVSYNLEGKPLPYVNKQEFKNNRQHILQAVNYSDEGLDYQRPRVNELWMYQLTNRTEK